MPCYKGRKEPFSTSYLYEFECLICQLLLHFLLLCCLLLNRTAVDNFSLWLVLDSGDAFVDHAFSVHDYLTLITLQMCCSICIRYCVFWCQSKSSPEKGTEDSITKSGPFVCLKNLFLLEFVCFSLELLVLKKIVNLLSP